MKVLKGIISDSWEYYQNIKSQLEKKLKQLPRGSVKKRILGIKPLPIVKTSF